MKKKLTLTLAAMTSLATLTVHAADGKDMKDMKDVKQMQTCASDAGFYVAVEGGADFSNYFGDRRSTLSGGGTTGDITPDTIHTDVRGVGGLRGGYAFQSWGACDGLRIQPAVEAEALYIGSETRAHESVPGGGAINDTTSYNNAAGFVNGIIHFKIDSCPVVPYLGVGVGAEYLTSHTDWQGAGTGHITGITGSSLDFAAQALAGIDFKLTEHWSIFTEYKFIDALGTDLHSPSLTSDAPAGGVNYRFKPDQFAQMVGVAGLKYCF